MTVDDLKRLREPFAPNQVGKLPKGGMMLDFVGHAFITARLLDVDPLWSWEPFALDGDGLPRLDEHGGLWIRLTVCEKTRIGYGDAGGKKGPNAIKEAIGDALRNAGMRFGMALELWAKGDLDAHPQSPPPKSYADIAREELLTTCEPLGWTGPKLAQRFKDDYGIDIRTANTETIHAFKAALVAEAESQDAEEKTA